MQNKFIIALFHNFIINYAVTPCFINANGITRPPFFAFCSWLPSIINIFADKNNFASVRADKLDSFYSCVTTLISNQVPLIKSTIIEYLMLCHH